MKASKTDEKKTNTSREFPASHKFSRLISGFSLRATKNWVNAAPLAPVSFNDKLRSVLFVLTTLSTCLIPSFPRGVSSQIKDVNHVLWDRTAIKASKSGLGYFS
jgi:hypothetical protein